MATVSLTGTTQTASGAMQTTTEASPLTVAGTTQTVAEEKPPTMEGATQTASGETQTVTETKTLTVTGTTQTTSGVPQTVTETKPLTVSGTTQTTSGVPQTATVTGTTQTTSGATQTATETKPLTATGTTQTDSEMMQTKSYIVFVASDVFHRKVNLELEFPFAPTLADLTRQTEQAFTAEQNAQRPGAGTPPFQVLKFHVVDEATDEWVEVFGAYQIMRYCQLYCFQPHSTRFTESQGHIPAAKKPIENQFGSLSVPVVPLLEQQGIPVVPPHKDSKSYVVFVASDVFGRKVNLELELPCAPTLADLTRQAEQAFTAEQNAQRPGAATPPFEIVKFHVVDEATDEWVEVFGANQIKHYCQLYCFQPHSTRYNESQGHIPLAKKPISEIGYQYLPSAPVFSVKQRAVVPTAPPLSLGEGSEEKQEPAYCDPPKSSSSHCTIKKESSVSLQPVAEKVPKKNERKERSGCCCIC